DAVTSTFACCFLPSGTAAFVSTFNLISRFGSDISVRLITFAVMPFVSKRTGRGLVRLRPSIVNVAVVPRFMPTGQMRSTVGGIVGPSAVQPQNVEMRMMSLMLLNTQASLFLFMADLRNQKISAP